MMRPDVCSQDRRGLSVVELLVTLAIAAVLLGVVGAFFSFQARTARDTQARNELNVRSRTVVEAITQDLRMAGARAVVDSDGRVDFRRQLPCDAATTPCLIVRSDPFEIEVEYVSSLFFGGVLRDEDGDLRFVCRRVVYRLATADTGEPMLFRSDRDCTEAGTAVFDFSTQFAPEIVDITLEFVCGPDDEGGPNIAEDGNPANCFVAPYSFIREAVVTVEAASVRGGRTSVVQLATSVPNARDPFRFAEP